MMRRARVGAIAVALAAGTAAWVAREIPAAMGGDPTRGERGERMRNSPRYRDGVFHNPPGAVRTHETPAGRTIVRELLFGKELRHPSQPIPLVQDVTADGPASQMLAVTWLGHATVLAEIQGRRVLFDPVWGERCTPVPGIGPRRLHPNPIPLAELGPIDVVVVSHDHYDHLDMDAIRALIRSGADFAVPLGVGAHLEHWGVPADRLVELDWQESARVAGLRR